MARCSQAVVLAAGIGSRLRPITLRKPKCCVSVDSTPILAHQLRAYADAGLSEVHVVSGYLHDRTARLCERVAADYDDFDVSVIENEVFANTDNLYSLSLAREAVDGEAFVLANGDVVFDPEIPTRLLADEGESAIACDTGAYSEEAMKVTADEKGRLTHISKEIPREEAYASSIDLYRFSPSFSAALFDELERIIECRGEYTGWSEIAIDRLLRTGRHDVRPVDVAGLPWVEIDDGRDLLVADGRFASIGDLRSKELAFFDLDGTIYLDDEPIDGAASIVSAFREQGTAVYFLSNNSAKWKTDYAAKLSALGIAAEPEDVILSTDGVIEYLRANDAEAVHVVGTEAMRRALADHGVAVDAEEPSHVVVGFDTELTYEKVRRATLAIRDGAEFLLAHPDLVCPTTAGLVPDCGSIGALVETATGREPARVFGKPNPEMIAHVVEERGVSPSDVVVVGDRLETEIRMAERLGCDSVCVLTGDADRAAVEESPVSPSLVASDVGALAEFL
ncbi:HAD-IIA family hydrolase [Halegenticoccus tardaugens]|uniref:HAD-IIA family hydrolase n=1 Tax=Halegenticoccus tardaugens TaxID=2071624 RepID=UPI00100AC797|nr:HAD-IIA family hydrolase [Halegenticoccus tardaugens]